MQYAQKLYKVLREHTKKNKHNTFKAKLIKSEIQYKIDNIN